jgi:hypothetical protein
VYRGQTCQGKSVSALAIKYGGLDAAAAALGFSTVQGLQDAIQVFCAGWRLAAVRTRGGNGLPTEALGKKIRVSSLLTDHKSMEEAVVNVYGEDGVKVRYCVRDLMWRPVGRLVRFVAVVHPIRGSILLMSTDLTVCALDIISIYGLRFKIDTCSDRLRA